MNTTQFESYKIHVNHHKSIRGNNITIQINTHQEKQDRSTKKMDINRRQ